jgi:YedE family putative selenium metabolism protein
MALRIAGGDLNAVVGLLGFIAGILIGIVFLKKGFTLGRAYKQGKLEGVAMTGINVALLVLLVAFPVVLKFSESGPGSMRAPLFAALAAGLIVGAIAQRTRLCMVGGLRDVVLFKDWTLVCGFIALIVLATIGNIATGNFHLGFVKGINDAGEIIAQPVAHTQHVWNFLGMAVVGLGSVLLGGCPLRQLILAGEGNTDSAVAVLGMFVGAAFCHNFGLASSGAGTTANGRIACILMLVVMLVIAVYNTKKTKA